MIVYSKIFLIHHLMMLLLNDMQITKKIRIKKIRIRLLNNCGIFPLLIHKKALTRIKLPTLQFLLQFFFPVRPTPGQFYLGLQTGRKQFYYRLLWIAGPITLLYGQASPIIMGQGPEQLNSCSVLDSRIKTTMPSFLCNLFRALKCH